MGAMSPPVRGRFAPSTTGHLHLGHAQTMLLAWLQIRALGGEFLLRIEDIDVARDRPEAHASIPRDLEWLGFDWDAAPVRQSERGDLYAAAIERLDTFPCTCSRREVREAAGARGEIGELRYPGTCRGAPSHPGRAVSLRVRVDPRELRWRDLWLGDQRQDPAQICGDFIVRSKGGTTAYQLAVVVDDAEQGVTHVLRGQDLVASTGRQILLYEALGERVPMFAHVPLRLDDRGQRLAKSVGSPPLRELRRAGEDPRRLIGELARDLGLLDEAAPTRPSDLIESLRERLPRLLR